MGVGSILRKIAGKLGLGQCQRDDVPMWDSARGENYKAFWTNMSHSEDEAVLVTYGKPAPEEERLESCLYIADYITEALEIGADKEVLEVGCGLGLYARTVGPKCKRYVGVDISPNMIEHSRGFVKDAGGNLEFHVLERSDLKLFPDASFDAVFFEAVLMHLAREDAFNYLCEAHRVLRPEGRLYATFQNFLQPEGFRHFLRMTAEADRSGSHSVGRVRFHTAPELRKMAWGAGFRIDEGHSRLELEENDSERHEARTLTLVGVKTDRPEWKTNGEWQY